MCVLFSSNKIIPVSPHASHVCAYIADVIYLPALLATIPSTIAICSGVAFLYA
jgi:hypothetical protein